jgi:hypothetical protein
MPDVIAVFVYFIPFFIIGWNAWKIAVYRDRTKRYVRTSARVVNEWIEEVPDELTATLNNPYTYFSPIIEFTTAEGSRYVLKYTEDHPDRPLYKIGEEITICYDPSEPRKFLIYDPKGQYLVAGAWIVVGLVLVYLLFFFRWDSKPPI